MGSLDGGHAMNCSAACRKALGIGALLALLFSSAPAVAQTKAAPTGTGIVKLPASTGKSAEMLEALHKSGGVFAGYTMSEPRTQIQLRTVSVVVLNQMDVFTEPMTSSTPGRYEFGGQSRVPTQVERNKVTETIRRSTAGYLAKRFHVISGAQFELAVIVSGRNGVYIQNGFNPWGVVDIRILLLDTQTKSVVWYNDDAWGLGKTLESATDSATTSTNQQLAALLAEDAK